MISAKPFNTFQALSYRKNPLFFARILPCVFVSTDCLGRCRYREAVISFHSAECPRSHTKFNPKNPTIFLHLISQKSSFPSIGLCNPMFLSLWFLNCCGGPENSNSISNILLLQSLSATSEGTGISGVASV